METRYNVYVLKSERNGKRYVGVASKDPRERLREHNAGSNAFTKNNIPFKLVYFEQDYCEKCARKREQFLKSGQGRKILDMIE